jgi:hypothetical protein
MIENLFYKIFKKIFLRNLEYLIEKLNKNFNKEFTFKYENKEYLLFYNNLIIAKNNKPSNFLNNLENLLKYNDLLKLEEEKINSLIKEIREEFNNLIQNLNIEESNSKEFSNKQFSSTKNPNLISSLEYFKKDIKQILNKILRKNTIVNVEGEEYTVIPFFISKYGTPYKISKKAQILTTNEYGNIERINITTDKSKNTPRNRVNLRYKENESKDIRITRLMAFIFLKDIMDFTSELPEIKFDGSLYILKHKDGNTLNDSLENIEVIKKDKNITFEISNKEIKAEKSINNYKEIFEKYSIDISALYGAIKEDEENIVKDIIKIISENQKIKTFELIKKYYNEKSINPNNNEWSHIAKIINILIANDIINLENDLLEIN